MIFFASLVPGPLEKSTFRGGQERGYFFAVIRVENLAIMNYTFGELTVNLLLEEVFSSMENLKGLRKNSS